MRDSLVVAVSVLLAGSLSMCCGAIPDSSLGVFNPGTGAIARKSLTYSVADTIGQTVVDESASANYRAEHGFWHSDIHLPTISEIRQAEPYSQVSAYAKVVSAGNDKMLKEFFIQDSNGTSGIRVNVGNNTSIHVSEGDMIDVSGVIKGSGISKYIDYPVVTIRYADAVSVRSVAMSNRALGGKGTDVVIPGGAGASNISLLVKTTGRVTGVDTATPCKFFYIDDGSGLSDTTIVGGKPVVGLRVSTTTLASGNVITPPGIGQYVAVTGICAPLSTTGGILAQIRPRSQDDIVVISQ